MPKRSHRLWTHRSPEHKKARIFRRVGSPSSLKMAARSWTRRESAPRERVKKWRAAVIGGSLSYEHMLMDDGGRGGRSQGAGKSGPVELVRAFSIVVPLEAP